MGYYISHKYCVYIYRNHNIYYKKKIPQIMTVMLIMCSVFAFFAGFRYDVGVDHLNYIDNYLYGNVWGKKYEFLYQLIIDVCKSIGLSFAFYFFIVAFIQIYSYYNAFKKNLYIFPFLSFFFFCNGEWLNFNNIMRCMVAAAIWLNSIQYIQNKDFKRYLLFVFVATLFHKSALLLVLCYPLLINSKDIFRSIFCQVIIFASILLVRIVFFEYIYLLDDLINWFSFYLDYEFYSSDKVLVAVETNKSGTGFGFIFRVFFNFIIILQSKKIKLFYRFNESFIIYYNIYFVGVLILDFIFPENVISLSRPFRYFHLFQNIMFAFYAYYLLRNKNLLNISLLSVLLLGYLTIFYYTIFTSNDKSHVLYQFCFDYL